MLELAALLKLMSLFAHDAHNLVSRVPFFQDHEYFGYLYPVLDEDYDSVIERIIGATGANSVDFTFIYQTVAENRASLPSQNTKQNSEFFKAALELEQNLCARIAALTPSATIGTQQMIGDIADRSEQRQYKLKQRLKT